MSSYDPDSVREMRPRTAVEQFVSRWFAPSYEVAHAEMVATATLQFDAAKKNRERLAKFRHAVDANWFTIGGQVGPRDAYIEAELAQKRAREAKAKAESSE